MNKEDMKLANTIFREALLVDFDFSQWDRRLRLVVAASDLGDDYAERRGLLHNVDFIRPAEISWRASHLGIALDSPESHFQWVILESNIEKKGEFIFVKLSGYGAPSPVLEISCRDLEISILDPAVVDQVNPSWKNPDLALARPGFEDLLEIHAKRRKR